MSASRKDPDAEMLSVRPADLGDAEKEWRFVREMPADENGCTNEWHGVTKERFLAEALPQMLRWSKGEGLPEGYVPETFLFLWRDGEIIGQFRIRHYLTEALRTGSGHIGYYIAPAFRGRGYGTRGLRLTLEAAREIVPESEFYLRVNKDNPASLRVMLNNGGRIADEDEEKYYVRIVNPGKNQVIPLFAEQTPASTQEFRPLFWRPTDGDQRHDDGR